MLIDKSYFIGEINIPNTSKVDVGEMLDLFIEKYEPVFLKALMGYDFYKAFTAGMAEETPDQRWKDIADGCDFTMNGVTQRWDGLVPKTPAVTLNKRSMIANYVYCHWMKNQFTQSVGLGEVKAKAENATVVSPKWKMVQAWNENYRQVCMFFDFMQEKKDTYPEWTTHHVFDAHKRFYRVNVMDI